MYRAGDESQTRAADASARTEASEVNLGLLGLPVQEKLRGGSCSLTLALFVLL
ncbi:MAG: hypothetical protein ACI841_003533, partial [Planctomycetota bacterium]